MRLSTKVGAGFMLLCAAASANWIKPVLIKGDKVAPGTWQEVVSITVEKSGASSFPCTATIVGPRVILTAAHCGQTGQIAKFTFQGRSYDAKLTRAPDFPSKDNDVSLGVTTTEIAGAVPFTIGGKAVAATAITILGYGCTEPQGKGTVDGALRIGASVIVGFSGPNDMISRGGKGTTTCFGDSGGPAFVQEDQKYLLLAVNSKSNTVDTNYHSRLDIPPITSFLTEFATTNGLTICGIKGECTGSTPAPDPTCRLTANPSSLKLNQSLALVLSAENATSADIDGTVVLVPNGEKRLVADRTGNFTSIATVKNAAGKTGTCSATYSVTDDAATDRPGCTLTAVPAIARAGQQVILELQTTGAVTYASIEGIQVEFPVGKLAVTAVGKGDISVSGFVRGPGGTKNCSNSYSIQDGVVPPTIPDFTIAATHCGPNQYPQPGVPTGLKSACLAVIKLDASWKSPAIKQGYLLTYNSGPQEFMPILARGAAAASETAGSVDQETVTYTGNLISGGVYPVIQTQMVKLTKKAVGDIPTALEGRSARGKLILVESLQAFDVARYLGLRVSRR